MTVERTMGTVTQRPRLTYISDEQRLSGEWCMVAELDAMRAERDAAIARAERAERLLARLLDWFEHRDVDLGLGDYDARDNVVLDDDMRQTIEAMRERVKP